MARTSFDEFANSEIALHFGTSDGVDAYILAEILNSFASFSQDIGLSISGDLGPHIRVVAISEGSLKVILERLGCPNAGLFSQHAQQAFWAIVAATFMLLIERALEPNEEFNIRSYGDKYIVIHDGNEFELPNMDGVNPPSPNLEAALKDRAKHMFKL